MPWYNYKNVKYSINNYSFYIAYRYLYSLQTQTVMTPLPTACATTYRAPLERIRVCEFHSDIWDLVLCCKTPFGRIAQIDAFKLFEN